MLSFHSVDDPSSYVQHHLEHLQLDVLTMKVGQNGGFWTLNLDSMIVAVLAALLFSVIFFIAARRTKASTPGKFQCAVEMVL